MLSRILRGARFSASARECSSLPSILDLGYKQNPERIVFAALWLCVYVANENIQEDILFPDDRSKRIKKLQQLLEHTHLILAEANKVDSPNHNNIIRLRFIFTEFGYKLSITENISCLDSILQIIPCIIFNEERISPNKKIYGVASRVLRIYLAFHIYRLDYINTPEYHVNRYYITSVDYIRDWNSLPMIYGRNNAGDTRSMF